MIPFTPLAKRLLDCTVALLSTAGAVRNGDRPFDQDGECRNPWWGDPSFATVTLSMTKLPHLTRAGSHRVKSDRLRRELHR